MDYTTTLKVRGYHLDFYGHVNNARYLELLEEARWRMLEGRVDLKDWQRRHLAMVIVRIEIDYRRGAVLGDELQIVSRLRHLGGRSGVVRQEVTRAGDGARIVDADVTFVVIDIRTGKSLPLEGEIRAAFESEAGA